MDGIDIITVVVVVAAVIIATVAFLEVSHSCLRTLENRNVGARNPDQSLQSDDEREIENGEAPEEVEHDETCVIWMQKGEYTSRLRNTCVVSSVV